MTKEVRMFPKIKYAPALVAAALLTILIAGVLPALAAPPDNDDFSTATIITSLPFSEEINTEEATAAPDDPFPSCNTYGVREATVWYQYNPAETQLVTASTSGSSYN